MIEILELGPVQELAARWRWCLQFL